MARPHSTQGGRLRIDYVFASEDFRAERVEVIENEATDRASDHYPLAADLVLEDDQPPSALNVMCPSS